MSNTAKGTGGTKVPSVSIPMVRVAVKGRVGGNGMYFYGVLIPWPNKQKIITDAGGDGNVAITTLPKQMAFTGAAPANGGSIAIIKPRTKLKALLMQKLGGDETATREELDNRVQFNLEAYFAYAATIEDDADTMTKEDWQKVWQYTAKAAQKEGIPGF